ncbi:MAG TPA: flagellar assembly protein FliW [Gemmatimonadales bacterium]|jgi:flagellar assembly factor FliW
MTAALQLDSTATTIATRLFGTLEITPDDVLRFAGGLPGFPQAERFVVLTTPAPALRWLQSADLPELAFLLVDYGTATGTEIAAGEEAYAIVTLPGQDRQTTANLRAPVLIDRAVGSGEQVILTDSSHGTAEPLDLDALLGAAEPAA